MDFHLGQLEIRMEEMHEVIKRLVQSVEKQKENNILR